MGKSELITASLVLYENEVSELEILFNSILCADNTHLIIIDNSKNKLFNKLENKRITYIKTKHNHGFGKGHNIALKFAEKLKSKFHLILNPDISFNPKIFKTLIKRISIDKNILMIMPKIIYPDGSPQFLCKLLPSPLNLFSRRFIQSRFILNKLNYYYEMKFIKHEQEMNVPVVSGCFMFFKTEVLSMISGFDERFFMYMEDVDICRRVISLGDILYYPKVNVIHGFNKGSYKNLKLLYFHIFSAIKYFNKWGWFFDFERCRLNEKFIFNLKK